MLPTERSSAHKGRQLDGRSPETDIALILRDESNFTSPLLPLFANLRVFFLATGTLDGGWLAALDQFH